MFKIGDKVRVKEDLKVGEKYGSNSFVKGMVRYRGIETTITFIDTYGEYRLAVSDNDFYWTNEMLEEVKEMYIAYNIHTNKLLHSGEQYIFTREELLEVANRAETPIGGYVIHEIADTPTKCFCVDLEEL